MARAGCQPTELRRACREVQMSTQGVGGCARLLQIQNHGVQQREITNARDTNGNGDFEISGQGYFLCHFEILATYLSSIQRTRL